jgi:hypothetical protein
MDDFALEALRRLPLAEAAYRLLDHALDEPFLTGVFQRHRGNSYEKVIGFPLFVRLIGDALLEHHGSGHKSFTRAQNRGDLDASLKAAYGKLARVPLPLSQGLLTEATCRLSEVVAPVRCLPALPSLKAFTLLAVDGKKLKHVAHRLKILRSVRGQVLVAKLLVALDMTTGLAVAMTADLDGETSDAPLVPGLLAQVRTRYQGPILYVEDRQFCDLVQPGLIRAAKDHYLIRYNAKVGFHPDASRDGRQGDDGSGRTYREEWGWLGAEGNPRRQYVRRITLRRPGEEDVILVTDLLDADRYPAAELLVAYLHRWGIERVFQRITEVFHLRSLIGSTPRAGVFQASFCLLLYNVVMVLRSFLAEARRREAETISTENVFYDVRRQVVALREVLSEEDLLTVLAVRPEGSLRQYLRGLLAEQWSQTWVKAPSRSGRPATDKEYLKGGHTSVFRLQQAARESRREDGPPGG